MTNTKREIKHIVGYVINGSTKESYIKSNGEKGEKCRLHIQSLPTHDGTIAEVAITCSGEMANYFYYRGMVDVQYVQRVYSPRPGIFINDAYAIDIKVM